MKLGDLVALRLGLRIDSENVSFDSGTPCLIIEEANEHKNFLILIEGRKAYVPIGYVRELVVSN